MNVDWSYWPCMTFFLVVRLGGGGYGDQYRKGLRRIQTKFQKESIYFAVHTLKQMWKRWLFSQDTGSSEEKVWVLPLGVKPMTLGTELLYLAYTIHVCALNRVCFSGCWVLNRVYNFTTKHLEQGVFLDWKPFKEHGDLRWAVYICNANNFFPKYLFPRF